MKRLVSIFLAFMLVITPAVSVYGVEADPLLDESDAAIVDTEVTQDDREITTFADIVELPEGDVGVIVADEEATGADDISDLVITGEETDTIENLPESDELFADYVNSVFGIKEAEESKPAHAPRRLSLDSQQQAIYNFLKEQISLVADGTISSTQFNLDSAIGAENITYTASELGVNEINENAKVALKAKLSTVMNALMFNYPYELYWFDKTSGYSYPFSYNTRTIRIPRISMNVSADYSSSGTIGTYTTDINKTRAATNAAATARQVIDEHAKELDYDKLSSFKDYILDAVDYNDDAAAGSVNYGDPWQLIWVFDNDSETKVVCEGYSKAFQYLCDQSTWHDEDFVCRCVSGEMDGGAHMWNTVTIGGDNYLVDVTNSEYHLNGGSLSFSPGCAGKLFMVGASSGNVSDGYVISWEEYGASLGGYTWTLPADAISYVYDTDATDVYDDSELSLASTDYDHSAETHRYSLSECGENENHELVAKYICDVCGTENDVVVAPASYIASLTLKDNIDINFYVKNLGDSSHPEYYWVVSSFAEGQSNELSLSSNLGDATLTDNGYRLVVANVYPFQMTQKAHIGVFYGDTLENAMANGCLYSIDYSVQDYFKRQIQNSTNDNMKALARAGLDYGANCQLFFNDKTYSMDGATYNYITDVEHLANADYNPDNTINVPQPVDYNTSIDGSVEGFSFKNAALILGTEVSMKIYFNWSGDNRDLSVTAVNNTTNEDKDVDILNLSGGTYTGAFIIDGIKSYELSDSYTIYVNYNGSTTALTYSPYTYATRKWDSSTEHLADLVKSLVAYGNAADTYFKY